MIRLSFLIITGITFGFFSHASYAANSIQFSADAIQSVPGKPEMRAKIFVGKNAVRNEYQVNGETYVELVRQGKNGQVILNPQKKEFFEVPGAPANLPFLARNKSKKSSPCEGVKNVTCRKLGVEKVNGRKTEKWEFVNRANNRELRSLHWIDVKKNFPIRELFPDGSSSEMRLLGEEQLDGRVTQRWEMVRMLPDGQKQYSMQWHDDELKFAIREVLPGGYMRELRNIKIGKQKDDKFKIPADYRQVTQQQVMKSSR